MNWKQYNIVNNILGWVAFAVAAVTYLLTIGPSASLWDCPEFILSAFKLEVGHPPGAPFYMLVYNVAAHLAPTPEQAGLYTNALSGLLSAGTILLLFWTITHLVRRVLLPGSIAIGRRLDPTAATKPSLWQTIVIMGSGLVGALLYTFTDTFWYSAVESEVYSFSSFLTALVFWLMLKWADRADNERSDRWIVLIAYIMGISIGVHLLNLLCIPAMALIYYFRKAEKPTAKGMIIAAAVSFALIAIIMFGIMQGVVAFGGTFDRWAVNGLGLPYNVGFYIYLLVLFAVLGGSLILYHKQKSRTMIIGSFLLSWILIGVPFFGGMSWLGWLLTIGLAVFLFNDKKLPLATLHTAQMCLLVIMIGFSSYGVILMRSIAGTPMNQNEPNTALALKSYLNREQYGSTPLLFGQSFASRPIKIDDGAAVYAPKVKASPADKDQYVKLFNEPKVQYSDKMLFPRMYSTQPAHLSGYNTWTDRNPQDMSTPSMADNLKYFLRYQVNYMYWRYFGWNFIGRQNDLQGDGGLLRGGVLTGISPIDDLAHGTSQDMPDIFKENKGRNVYYLMPLILGFLGIAYQVTRQRKGMQAFWITLALFFMTGLAIILYLNQTPGQPRERDYAYAASFYAFAIWIGFGVAALFDLLRKARLSPVVAASVATALGCIVPIQMAGENWDDHDRSGRVLASDFGHNYLISCDPNSVLLCFGDNDTFPLWYAQEVEGVRPDIKIANLSYLQSDWYGKHMLRASYDAQPIPNRYMTPGFFVMQAYARVQAVTPTLPYDQAMEIVTKPVGYGMAAMPTEQLMLPLDRDKVLKHYPQLKDLPWSDYMALSVAGKGALTRESLFVLDMVGAGGWERPLFWVLSSPQNAFSNQQDYMTQLGVSCRLNPLAVRGTEQELDVDRTYDLVMNQYRYFNANDPDIYFDENIRRNISYYYRARLFGSLSQALIMKGDIKRAQEVLKKCDEVISPQAVPYGVTDINLAQSCYLARQYDQGDKILSALYKDATQILYWVSKQRPALRQSVMNDESVQYALASLMELVRMDLRFQRGLDRQFAPQLQQALPLFGGTYEGLKQMVADQLIQELAPLAAPASDSNDNK